MRAMRMLAVILLYSSGAIAAEGALTERDFRGSLGVGEAVHLSYRGLDCKPLTFDAFAKAMSAASARSDVDRAADGSAVTVTVKRKGGDSCPSPYPPVSQMPPFALRDLGGKTVTAASLKGKPTLVSFFFAHCPPCILEVGPLNDFAASRHDLRFLAVTFDEAPMARDFVARFKLRWRVVPDASDLIDRLRIKQYPTLALFDAEGRLLGTRLGGVRDELEAATVAPQISKWVDGLLRVSTERREVR